MVLFDNVRDKYVSSSEQDKKERLERLKKAL